MQSSEHVAAKAKITDKALARLDTVDKPWEGWDLRLTIADAGRGGDVVARLADAVVERPGVDGDPGLPARPGVARGRVGRPAGRRRPQRLGQVDPAGGAVRPLPLASGSQWVGPSVVVGEISQRRDLFAGAPTPARRLPRRHRRRRPGAARSALAKFGLSAEHVERAPESLSPGERTRATLAVLQVRGVNVLVLDEPTNHLDLEAVEQLEQAIEAFAGTLVLVTHDRTMLDAVGIDRVVEVDVGPGDRAPLTEIALSSAGTGRRGRPRPATGGCRTPGTTRPPRRRSVTARMRASCSSTARSRRGP